MKTLLIETVTNGWIVRPFSPCRDWVVADRPEIAVFNRMIDLQTALPDLLAEEKLIRPPTAIRRPPTDDDDFIKVGGDFQHGAKFQAMVDDARERAAKDMLEHNKGGDRRPETIGGNELTPSA